MAETEDRTNPLLEARPPATDYLTYLTLLEYNLKPKDLALLNDILQDTTLTINIGWDLVFLLIPMLPASQQCLNTIARLGNPREVLLKVIEALRCIDFMPVEVEDGPDGAPSESRASRGAPANDSSEPESKAAKHDLPLIQFKVLLSMLSILHGRIKTKYPSRFVATSVQGVLAAFSNVDSGHGDLLESICSFVLETMKSRRPGLPPRDNTRQTLAQDAQSADPEAQPEASSQEEHQITKRLLQGFLTHVMEVYLMAISAITEEIPGLAWSSRVFEIMQPRKLVPGRPHMQQLFATDETLVQRKSAVAAITNVAFELGLDTRDFLRAALEADQSSSSNAEAEEDPPDSADDIPLSKIGALFLLAARVVDHALDETDAKQLLDLAIFPTQLQIAQSFIGTEEAGGLNTAGSEPSSVIDAVIALGLVALKDESIGGPDSDEEFAQYLQCVTLISANSPEPSLRYHAHFLASSLLRAHPSDMYRLTFIRDTLEHCPIENLKASAVGWIKGETLEANLTPDGSSQDKPASVFATPVALETLKSFLFPDLKQQLGAADDLVETWTVFKMNLAFYLAALNFFYLLISAPQLHGSLNVAALDADHHISDSMLGVLRQKSAVFRESLKSGDLAEVEGELGVTGAFSDLDILDDVLERIERQREQQS